jgi:lysophospholipid acyltransferase (LPLAT)-like uncharacterized protein
VTGRPDLGPRAAARPRERAPAPAPSRELAASFLGVFLGIFVRLYLKTLRVTVIADTALDPRDPRPWVLCFWHGEQLPLLLYRRRRPTVALVSHSRDGQMQARALRIQGLLVERGSSSRGGARGLVAIVRRLARGQDAAFALDGPKGPRGTVRPGARAAARLAGGLLVPMGSAAPEGVTLARTWDHFRIPLPGSRVAVRLGAPLAPTATDDDLARAVTRASELASHDVRVLGSARNAVLRSARRA